MFRLTTQVMLLNLVLARKNKIYRDLMGARRQASIIINMTDDEQIKKVTLRQQPFSVAEKLHDFVAETYRLVKKTVPTVQRSMSLYLANRDTEAILFKPIKVKVQERFQQLSQILTDHYTEEDRQNRQIVACPRAE